MRYVVSEPVAHFSVMWRSLLLITLLMVIFLACSELNNESIFAPEERISYLLRTKSALDSQCVSCHSGISPAGSYDLSTLIGIFGTGTDNVPNAIPGDANSLLVKTIQPDGSMYEYIGSSDNAELIYTWVVDDKLGLSEGNAHPVGWQNPDDREHFHGVYLRTNNWNFDLCTECHGSDFSGGVSESSCLTCHEDGPQSCNTCHGRSYDPAGAPPADVEGNVSTTVRGVGGHQQCITGGVRSRPVECSECHIVPTHFSDPGHIDSSPHAEVTWGTLATAAGSDPEITEDLKCKNTYCHGSFNAGIRGFTPQWTEVDGSQAICASCHALPPVFPTHNTGYIHLPTATDCSLCHGTVIDSGQNFIDKTLHIDGELEAGHINGWNDQTDAANFHGVFLQGGNWDISSCATCHGTDYAGGFSGITCNTCHSGTPEACNTCHGSSADATGAPPKDLLGGQATTYRGVGAHTAHLTGGDLSEPVACAECHTVPSGVGAPGHIDSTPYAELTFGTLASTGGVSPEFTSNLTCKNTYCHGAFSAGEQDNEPEWTVVDGTQDACGSCHQMPPAGPTRNFGMTHFASYTECYLCHGSVVDSNNNIIDKSKHINGIVNQ